MLSKNEAKYIQSLYHKKNRDDTGLFIAEGPKLVEELLNSSFEIKKIYALKDWLINNATTVQVEEITQQELERISNQAGPNKTLAVVKQKKVKPPVLENRITLILDGIQDPGNLGTIIRVADWFGIDTIIASENTVDVYNPKVIQSTMGSICRVNVIYENIIALLKATKITKYGAVLNGAPVNGMNKIKEGILIIGNEGNGISKEVSSFINAAVTIPGKGNAESLNAAVATGILLSHLV
ncbi:MAG: methyltransferase [Chitinophagaceae bacterium]|nr:methyltransferase [Chitinophagaceae bacterium]